MTVRNVRVSLLVAKTNIPEDLRPQKFLNPHNSKPRFPLHFLLR